MRLLKRVCCLLTAVLLVLSIAACGSSEKKSSKEDSSAEIKDQKESGELSGDWEPQSDLSKHVTITYASVQGMEGYDYTNGDDLARYYSEKFNYTLEVTALTWSNWNERTRIWINSGDMPDVMVFNFTQTNYPEAAGYVEQGLLYKLPDDWKSRWTNLAKVFDITGLGRRWINNSVEHIFAESPFL